MTKYLNDKFSVNVGSEAYRDGWERVFGKKDPEPLCDGCVPFLGDTPEWTEVDTHPDPESDIRKQVAEFHRAMGQPVNELPLEWMTDTRLKLRLNLIAEEFVELLEASGATQSWAWDVRDAISGAIDNLDLKRFDLVEVSDALGDLDYVNEGMRLELGVNGAPIAAEIHRSNMAKVGGPIREDGKRLKPIGWTPPDVAGELRKQGWQG